MKEIIIEVKSGAVVNVSGVPSGVVVKVVDFDIDGSPEDQLEPFGGDLARVDYYNAKGEWL